MTHATTFTLPSDLDIARAGAVHEELIDVVSRAHSDNSVELDISDGAPTQVSLQLFFSALADLKRKNALFTLGAHAGQVAAMAPPASEA